MKTMVKEFKKIAGQAVLITLFSFGVAASTNYARSDGIPLIAQVPYEIFAPCRDSEATSLAVVPDEIGKADDSTVLYVDARPLDAFALGHVEGAINVPYSALFGASEDGIRKVRESIRTRKVTSVIVYGAILDPSASDKKVSLAKPLAEQLIETGIEGVRHMEGGLEALNKQGLEIVKGARGEE